MKDISCLCISLMEYKRKIIDKNKCCFNHYSGNKLNNLRVVIEYIENGCLNFCTCICIDKIVTHLLSFYVTKGTYVLVSNSCAFFLHPV